MNQINTKKIRATSTENAPTEQLNSQLSAPPAVVTGKRAKKLPVATATDTQDIARISGAKDALLTEAEIRKLQSLESTITSSQTNLDKGFFETAEAFRQIKADKLYRSNYKTFEAYCASKWKMSRSHAYRIAGAGEIIARNKKTSPNGDETTMMNTESHFRALMSLKPEEQDAVVAKVAEWAKWSDEKQVTPKLVEAAKAFLNPPTDGKPKDEKKNSLVEKIETAADEMKSQLPKNVSNEISKLFDTFKKKVSALGNPRRSSGIDWTDATWNPLQGCTRASAGCDNCYAAKDVATRLAHVYPGLALMKMTDKKKTYAFGGAIKLLPEQLGEPLRDLVPRRYFVNSMSDLFHKDVPEAFIEAVFDVMSKAHWHQFQVLTKRPGRMAEFTAKYFNGKTPPANIWLGTSAENQEALDERLPHLQKTVAAVKWLSCEPLIGPIEFDSLDGVNWLVVGGESGPSARKMEKAWATSMRDACKGAGVPFFFKQWGTYGEDETKTKKPKKDGLTPATLDGFVHNEYPLERLVAEPKVQAAE